MRTIRKKIDKSEYERLMETPKAEQMAEIEQNIPRAWVMGYGYYGYYLTEEDDGCFICFRVGSSCD